ncbi:N-acetylmuramoyl-L-alanine amidase [Bacillus sp. TS-2]|nr:N-acetylmuramoyl-L-alanine amidase [Bacillus sp. TS-2]
MSLRNYNFKTIFIFFILLMLLSQPVLASQQTLKEGMYHDDVIQLKIDLDLLGYKISNNPTDHFGPVTEEKVKEFQKDFGLPVTGVVDQNTFKKIDEAIANSILKNGVKNDAVIALKKDLAKVGYPVPGNTTNHFGPQTEQVVKSFQKDYGLTQNGLIDNKTRQTIDDILSGKLEPTYLRNGVHHKSVVKLKQDLAKAAYPVPGNNTEHFGPQTEKVVIQFQKDYGLTQDGVVGKSTLQSIQDVLSGKLEPAVLKDGIRHKTVIKLKEDLAKIGYPVPGNNTDHFGPQTEKVIIQFQKDYRLTQNGTVDNSTKKTIQDVLSGKLNPTNLRDGVHHQAVVQLKKDLTSIGFPVPGNHTTHFGPKTDTVVRQFQKAYGLSQNGIVNASTLQVITDVKSGKRELLLLDGVHHKSVIQLKKDLASLGYLVSNNPTSHFGPQTERQVRDFQRHHNLTVNGIANTTTLNKLKNIVSGKENPHLLRLNVYHSSVIKLKNDLAKAGFPVSNNPTDYFGPTTERKVKDFQRSQGLTADGIAGPATLTRLAQVISTPPVNRALTGKTIVVDPGHGGTDPGAVANGLLEKEIVLDVSLRLKKHLEAAGAKVIMTRSTDVFLRLEDRARIANTSNADAFISVHANAGGGTGIETFWNSTNTSSKSQTLATNLQREMIRATNMRDRGVKTGNFHVIRETRIPSALVEVGFVDTISDASKLRSPSYRENVAKGIYNGVVSNFK